MRVAGLGSASGTISSAAIFKLNRLGELNGL